MCRDVQIMNCVKHLGAKLIIFIWEEMCLKINANFVVLCTHTVSGVCFLRETSTSLLTALFTSWGKMQMVVGLWLLFCGVFFGWFCLGCLRWKESVGVDEIFWGGMRSGWIHRIWFHEMWSGLDLSPCCWG